MNISSNIETNNNSIINPLLKNKMELQLEDNTVVLSLINMSKFFQKIYVLCPFKNDILDDFIFDRKVPKDKWQEIGNKLVLSETSIKLINNFDHNHNLTLVNSSEIEQFNHFGFELSDKILVLPIFNISYLNIKNYLKIYEGNSKMCDLYNTLVLNQVFSNNSKLNYNSLLYITDIIKNLDG